MKVIEQQARTVDVVKDRLCDLCGGGVYDRSKWPLNDDGDRFDEDDSIHATAQYRYLGSVGGQVCWTKTLDLDFCPACWESNVLPALVALGLKPSFVER